MRGGDKRQDGLFSYVSLEARVPANRPLCTVRTMVDEALKTTSRDFVRLLGGASVDRSGATASRTPVAGVLPDRQ